MRKTLHKRLRPLCFTSARVEYSPSDSRVLRTVGNTSSLPPFTSHWECRVQSPLEGLNTGVISFCLQLDGPLSIKVKYIFASWVEKEDYLYSVEKCTDDFLFFLIRKFYFGLQEGIATILIRMLGCHNVSLCVDIFRIVLGTLTFERFHVHSCRSARNSE